MKSWPHLEATCRCDRSCALQVMPNSELSSRLDTTLTASAPSSRLRSPEAPAGTWTVMHKFMYYSSIANGIFASHVLIYKMVDWTDEKIAIMKRAHTLAKNRRVLASIVKVQRGRRHRVYARPRGSRRAARRRRPTARRRAPSNRREAAPSTACSVAAAHPHGCGGIARRQEVVQDGRRQAGGQVVEDLTVRLSASR